METFLTNIELQYLVNFEDFILTENAVQS